MAQRKSPPLVLIHGMWSHAGTLAALRQKLEQQGHSVHTPSLPHHDPASLGSALHGQHLARTSIRDYVNFLVAYVQRLDEPPILIGHSMGGLLAQLVAAKLEVAGLVLLASAAPAGINGWRFSVIRTLAENLLRFPLWKKTTKVGLRHIRVGIANTQPLQVQQEIARDLVPESGLATWEIGMWFLYRKPATRVVYAKSHCPVLIIGGQQDRITPIHIQRQLAERYGRRSSLITLPQACHWLIGGEHLGTVTGHVSNWLADQSFT